jgi:hypothetical protein
MSSAPPPTKELQGGRYVLVAPLGQGSQGTTWDAVDKRAGRAVAIKAFDVRGARAWKDVELAEREARVLSELEHPLLPRYVEHFESDGVLYLVMEKVDGTPLSVLQKRGRGMPEADVERLLRDADVVLTYLHGRSPPVIHRDLKPANVIQRPDGSFAFVDFGAVKDHLRIEGGSTVVGTFGYMAPEQFQGRAGPASDVYAIGATAIAMLTGLEPEKLPHRGLAVDVDAALRGRASAQLRDVLGRMLEPDPDRRATRIGPLLGPTRRGPRSQRDGSSSSRTGRSQPWQPDGAWDFGNARHARRAARRAAKQARKQGRRDAFGASAFRLPFVLRFPILFALTVARIVVALLLQVTVPLVLMVLSVLFGSGLRRAARQVRVAGGHVGETLVDVTGQVQGGWGPGIEAAPVRVSSPEARAQEKRARVRARAPDGAELQEEEVERDDEAAESPRQRGRSRL